MIDLLLSILLQVLLQLSLVLLPQAIILSFILITGPSNSRMQCLVGVNLNLWLVDSLD